MKLYKIAILPAVLLVVISCNKTLEIDPLHFDVSTEATTYQAGDTVHFDFKGNPDFISFYSGEEGHKYENKDRILAEGTAEMQFSSWNRYGTQQTLSLFISKDFDGRYNKEAVESASWTDISDDADLTRNVDENPSGVINLSKYVDPGEEFFFAFRYKGSGESTQGQTFVYSDFRIYLTTADLDTIPIVENLEAGGWVPVQMLADGKNWQVRFDGSHDDLFFNSNNPGVPDNEAWAITKVLNPNKVEPDRAEPIKDISENPEGFDYVFEKKGKYTVVFKAVNASADKQKEVLKSIDLVIE